MNCLIKFIYNLYLALMFKVIFKKRFKLLKNLNLPKKIILFREIKSS